MGLVSGLKDGGVLGLGVVIAWYIIKRPPLTIFGQSDYYPDIDGVETNPDNFNPDAVVSLGTDSIEAKAVKKLMNKYCHEIKYDWDTDEYLGVHCCPTIEEERERASQGGSYGIFLQDVNLPETNYFSDEDQTVLFNRYKVHAITYRQLYNAIRGKDIDGKRIIYDNGEKAPNNANNFIRDCRYQNRKLVR